jgi:hypothetical protein
MGLTGMFNSALEAEVLPKGAHGTMRLGLEAPVKKPFIPSDVESSLCQPTDFD